MTDDFDLDSLSNEIEDIEKRVRIKDNKKLARDYEQKNEWADALRIYTEILKDDPKDEQALTGVKRTRDSLLTRLYDEGRRAFEASQWAAAITAFDRLLDEAKQAGLNDYKDARAKRQQAQKTIAPPSPPPPPTLPPPPPSSSSSMLWWVVAGGAVAVLALIVVVIILVLRLTLSPSSATQPPMDSSIPQAPTETPATELVIDTPTSKPATNTPVSEPITNTPIPEPPTNTPPPLPADTNTPIPQPADTDTPTPESSTNTPTPPQVAKNPMPSPTLTGKIAVPVFDSNAGAYHVYIARAADDWQPELFLKDSSQPAFSPDGRWLILRTWPSESHHFGQRMVLFPSLSIDAGNERWMTNSFDDAHPSLRSDGEIVFHTRRGKEQPAIFTLGTWEGAENDEANQNELGPGVNPDWLGNSIVYYAPNPAPGLYVKDPDGSTKLILKETGALVPAAAPDGDRVTVSLKRDGNWHIFVLSASRGQASLIQLTTEIADDQLPVWSPDGQAIAFASNREGIWAVWVMNADGTDQRKLFNLNGSIDGVVSHARDKSFGWGEERLSWMP